MEQLKPKVVMIGAGNLATNLAVALQSCGFDVVEVYSRSGVSAKELAARLECRVVDRLSDIRLQKDLYVIAVPDNAIEEVIAAMPLVSGVVVHTSGSTPMDVFSQKFSSYGVLYPFQTFSRLREVDFSSIPICIEASSSSSLLKLEAIAKSLSASVLTMDSDTRKWLHLVGVFASNFANHSLALANEVAQHHGIPFAALKPLVAETIQKALDSQNPAAVQTGPAVRHDAKTINRHLEMLASEPDFFSHIYKLLTSSIQQLDEARKNKNQQK